MLGKALEYQHQGQTELIWRAAGLLCRFRLPLSEVTVTPSGIRTRRQSALHSFGTSSHGHPSRNRVG
jgi:hypothetical protein